jgi:peroxiredoxin
MRTSHVVSIISLMSVSVALALILTCAGCGSNEPAEKPASTGQPPRKSTERQAVDKGDTAKVETPARKTRKASPKVEEPPPKPTVPKVNLTAKQRATCLVQVGDAFPDATLPDLEGKTQDVKSLYGEKLTVVCLWGVGDPKFSEAVAVDMLQSLQQEFAEPFAGKGVRVIGIPVESPPEAVAPLATKAGAKFPELLDAEKTLFTKVASEKLPRVYLLDAGGKILWFDVEYSRSTRRDLLQAIQVTLGEI